MKNKYSKTKIEHNNLINQIKDDLSTKRIGYYKDSTNLLTEEDREEGKPGDPYTYIINIRELDRYTNDISKIQLESIEVISGFSPHKYEWVKTCAKDVFSSLRKTSDIEWLESEENIKEQRKQKLKKIFNE